MENLLNFKEFDIKEKIKPKKGVIAKNFLFEGAMSTLDIIKQNSKNINEFIKQAKKEFPQLEGEENNAWLKRLYFTENKLTESMDESGLYIIYCDDDDIEELYRGKFDSYDEAYSKAEEIYIDKNQDIEHFEVEGPFNSDDEIDQWIASFTDEIPHNKTFESVTDNIIKGNEITSAYNADEESKNLFGFAQIKDQTIKKIGSFTNFTKIINPKTPKERPVLNAGQFIDNDIVKGYVNRIEGNKVYIESLEKPGDILEVALKDAVKVKKQEKEHTVKKKIENENNK